MKDNLNTELAVIASRFNAVVRERDALRKALEAMLAEFGSYTNDSQGGKKPKCLKLARAALQISPKDTEALRPMVLLS